MSRSNEGRRRRPPACRWWWLRDRLVREGREPSKCRDPEAEWRLIPHFPLPINGTTPLSVPGIPRAAVSFPYADWTEEPLRRPTRGPSTILFTMSSVEESC